MTKRTRRKIDAGRKAKIALEELREEERLPIWRQRYGVHPTQVYAWKKQLQEQVARAFDPGTRPGRRGSARTRDRKAAREDRSADGGAGFFSQKVWTMSAPDRRAMVDRDDPSLPVVAQCRLLRIARSTLYYRPVALTPMIWADAADGRAVSRLAVLWISPMVAVLRREGLVVNRKRVQRLMRLMGLEAIYQKPMRVRASGSQGVPVPATGTEHRAAEPSLVADISVPRQAASGKR